MTDRWSLGGRIRGERGRQMARASAERQGSSRRLLVSKKKIIMFNYASHASRPIVYVQCTVLYSHQMSDAYMPVHAL